MIIETKYNIGDIVYYSPNSSLLLSGKIGRIHIVCDGYSIIKYSILEEDGSWFLDYEQHVFRTEEELILFLPF